MSFPVATAALQLPTYGEPTILVNDGTDVVYVGVRRDTLTADGFPLQPLAQLTLDGTSVYYAQAASGVQALDMLPGGLGFAPSPGQIAAQLVASTLASIIATDIANSALAANTATAGHNTGSRLVDDSDLVTVLALNPQPAGQMYGVNSAQTALTANTYGFIDTRGYHSLTVSVKSNAQTSFTIIYLDSSNNFLFSRTYEAGSSQTLVVADNLYGPHVALTFTNVTGANGILSVEYRLSNRVLSGEVIECLNVDGPDSGFLLSQTGTVAAGALSSTFQVPPINGKYGISLGLGFAAQFKWYYGSQQSGTARLLPYTPQPQNVYFEIPSTRLSMYLFLKSTETTLSSTFGISVVRSKS